MTAPRPFERYGALSRRGLLRAGGMGLTGAGAALLFGCGDDGPKPLPAGPEPPPEVTRVRFPVNDGTICLAPMYVAGLFLPEEGFTEVEYVPGAGLLNTLLDGTIDFNVDFAASLVSNAEAGARVAILAGLHAACFQLLARDEIRSVHELRTDKIAVGYGENLVWGDYAFMATLLEFVGIRVERTLVSHDAAKLPQLLRDGEIDAVMVFPPFDKPLRDAGINNIILDSTKDAPWSQYYCCMLEANLGFVKRNPVATKRVVRATLKATDLCASDPERAAQYLVAQGHTEDYDWTLKSLKHIAYDVWRRYDPEDSLRFYALRLRDAGIVKIKPDEMVKRNADWRFINALKQELAFAPRAAGRGGFALNCEIDSPYGPIAAAVPVPGVRS